MARNVNGSSTIIVSTRRICRMVGKYGTGGIASATSSHPAFLAAVIALVAACQVWESLDDFPGEIDQTPGGETDPA
jgi:hypothetical protein